jgi:hypothetical protein
MAQIPLLNAQTGTAYTLVLADAGKLVTLSNAAAITLTVPVESTTNYAIGTSIDFLQAGVGQVTVVGAGGVTVNATPSLKLRTQSSAATLIKVASNTWQLVGDLESTSPAFRAYSGGSVQTVGNGVNTKVTLNTEVFDTNNNFDSTTNYRFTPTVAGYYQFSASVYGTGSSSLAYNYIKFFKNGSQDSAAIYGPYVGVASIGALSALIYLNGSTDYVELYAEVSGTGTLDINVGSSLTFLSGFLARAA